MQPLVFLILMIMNILFYSPSEYSVPLERISETQLALCHPERELLPLVLAHCHYTLKTGGETGSSYDLPGIQTQLVRRFLAGKPLIKAVKVKPDRTAACRHQVIANVVLTSSVVLFDHSQDTSRYLNRRLQDFSVVLTEVRDKIPQVRASRLLVIFITLRYKSLHLELTNASRRMFAVVSPVGFCEATLLEVKFLPSHSPRWPADSFSVCTAGAAEGLCEQRHEDGAALVHGRLRRRVRGGDRPALPRQDGRRSSGSASVLPR